MIDRLYALPMWESARGSGSARVSEQPAAALRAMRGVDAARSSNIVMGRGNGTRDSTQSERRGMRSYWRMALKMGLFSMCSTVHLSSKHLSHPTLKLGRCSGPQAGWEAPRPGAA